MATELRHHSRYRYACGALGLAFPLCIWAGCGENSSSLTEPTRAMRRVTPATSAWIAIHLLQIPGDAT